VTSIQPLSVVQLSLYRSVEFQSADAEVVRLSRGVFFHLLDADVVASVSASRAAPGAKWTSIRARLGSSRRRG
jgi:hypothetical protein